MIRSTWTTRQGKSNVRNLNEFYLVLIPVVLVPFVQQARVDAPLNFALFSRETRCLSFYGNDLVRQNH